jgi:hypothetical protein
VLGYDYRLFKNDIDTPANDQIFFSAYRREKMAPNCAFLQDHFDSLEAVMEAINNG